MAIQLEQTGEQGAGSGWDAVGHTEGLAWLGDVVSVVVLVACAIVAILVVRALFAQRRYRVTEMLGDEECERVHQAIRDVEVRTVGEVLPVVVGRSDRHPGANWISALVFLLAGSALVSTFLPWHQPALVLLLQAAFGTVGYLVASRLPHFARLFVSRDRATEMADEQAFQEFYRHALHETEARTGVLIFVSLLEHRVVVLADTGIAEEVEPEAWEATRDAVLAGLRRDSLTDGLVDGIRQAGELLAERFPYVDGPDGQRNEIPDRLIVRDE